MKQPKVGIGVIIENQEGKILVGKRLSEHAPYYSIPGGHLELGETFEATAIREVFEETGLTISNPKVICVTNNLRTFELEKQHYVSIILGTKEFNGTLETKEKDKCEAWNWVSKENLPQPHFDASEFAIECYLKGEFYIEGQK